MHFQLSLRGKKKNQPLSTLETSVQVNVRAAPEISVGSRGCPAGPPVLADDRSLRRQGGDGFRLSSNQPDSGSTSERALQRPSPPRGIRDNADLWKWAVVSLHVHILPEPRHVTFF